MNVDKIRKAIENLKEIKLQFDFSIHEAEEIEDEFALEALNDNKNAEEALALAIQALTKQLINQTFEWRKCIRKNGTEFLKLTYYSRQADGYVEAGRFNMSKHELVQNEWNLDEILRELEG